MATARFNGKIIAESDTFEVVEGNVYFPPSALKMEFFKPTATTTTCGWKGTCNYYTVSVDGKDVVDAAWVYKTPKDAAKNIAGHVAFWKGVEVSK
jgi:uncharacterized protein (DUF427 family)